MNIDQWPLFDWVKTYSDLGWHRTGTTIDTQTLDWVSDLATELGGQVKFCPYEFSFYSADVKATDFHIEALYYSFAGEGNASAYAIERLEFDAQHGDFSIKTSIAGFVQKAKKSGAKALVLATGDSKSELVAINRPPRDPGDFPVFLIAGKDFERLKDERPELQFKASLENNTSSNLLVEFGDFSLEKPPLMITTPVSGWYNCAGERGTGLAIAISVASKIGRDYPVILLCPSGHELGYFGAEKFVEFFDTPLKAVLHIGSCVAVKEDPCAVLTARSNLTPAVFNRMAKIVAVARTELERPADPLDRYQWFGEAECWASSAVPMISVAGTFGAFHTLSDTAELATGPDILGEREAVFMAIANELVENDL